MRRVVLSAFVLAAIGACRTYDTTYTEDAGNACVAPRITCGGTCVDPMTDRANCNGCGFACTANALCEKGVCIPCQGNQVACGSSGAAFCTDTTSDSANCGQCGNACAHGSTCTAGKCVCPLTTCGGGDGGLPECVDLQTNAAHCGACDTPCPQPGPNESAVCSSAQCSVVCAPPFADCDGLASNGCEANLKAGASSCGVCNRTCAGGGACTNGSCPTQTYFSNGSQLAGTAVDSTFVYWADRNTSGAIKRAPIGGGAPQTYYADNVATVLASDATYLVWLHLNTQVDARPLSGGAVTLLATASGILAMTVNGGFVYYGAAAGVVARVPVDGSAQPTTITSISSPQSVATDGTNVYVASVTGDVFSAPASAQNAIATTFAAGANAVEIAIDGTNVYWATNAGKVVSHDKSSSSTSVLATQQTVVTNLVTDGAALYWGAADGTIRELPVSGGTPLVLASGEGQIASIAIDATSVYWTSTDHVRSTSK